MISYKGFLAFHSKQSIGLLAGGAYYSRKPQTVIFVAAMQIHQFYTNCLAEASYILISGNEAVVVDPIRDVAMYLDYLKTHNATLKYVLETHFHADFVSGHQELAKATGATIVYGPTAKADYNIYTAQDHERLSVGQVEIEVLHTPGHTPESVCYLVWENGKPHSVFSGDTLFVGDVGRPDLLEGLIASTQDQIGNLYHTIQQVIKKLPADLVVYPAHGPGSMCGKSIGKETQTTIGKELATNYALQDLDRASFEQSVLADQLPAPWYFQQNALKNRQQSNFLDSIVNQSFKSISPANFSDLRSGDTLILDVRQPGEFAAGHIPGSINVGLNGSFAIWVGTLVHNLQQPIAIVAPEGKEKEAIVRLARVGYENVSGYLTGGIEAWNKAGFPLEKTQEISAEKFAEEMDGLQGNIVDVRGKGEWADGHLEKASSLPLRDFPSESPKLDPSATYYVHCAGGYRSMIAASWLQRAGFQNVINVQGGYGEIRKHMPVSA